MQGKGTEDARRLEFMEKTSRQRNPNLSLSGISCITIDNETEICKLSP